MWELQSGGWGRVRPRVTPPQRWPLLLIRLQIQRWCTVQVWDPNNRSLVQNPLVKSKYILKHWIHWLNLRCLKIFVLVWVTYVSVSTVTETALAVRIASLSRLEQGARNPLALPVKAYPPAQVSASCWCNARTAATTWRLFSSVFCTFFKMINC